METPITEHPKFKELLNEIDISIIECKVQKKNFCIKGAKAAQSILSEIHKKEMEEFDIWRDKNGFHRNKLGQYDNGKQMLGFTSLLDLFRKERDND